ncbi:MAG TPA: xanthine dehydrogenase family protein molybdopterin-binding subunit [Euzebyales bacterium]|nr:xanthine dehydrogenase family protein molybdopterin-binding subunit [Euzebyales bacterium]
MTAIGRREDPRLVTGRGRYVSGLRRDGMLHCAFARSSIAHGVVEAVVAEKATPGVSVLTAADLDLRPLRGRVPHLDNPAMARPPLATDRVRYVGEPVAVALSEDPAAAVDAAGLVRMDIAPLPTVVGVDAALAGTTLLFDAAGDNVVGTTETGDHVDLDRWPVCVGLTVENQRLAPLAIEPLAIVAEPDGEGGLTVWCGHQAPHRLKAQLSQLLGLDRLRVIVPDVGGAFGMKGMLFPEYVVVAACALRTSRPVGWTESRTEHFLGGTHGRSMRHRIRLAGERSGRLRAAEIDITANVGAYPHNGALIPTLSAWVAQGPYDLEQLRVRTTSVVTNGAPTGSYRGAGRPEAAYALERAVDAFAHAAGVDPVAVRHASLIRSTQLPYRTRTGALYDSGDYAGALDRALELIGADDVRAAQRDGPTGGIALGLGVAVFIERAGGSPDSSEYARVELTADGPEARVGTADSGQGHATVWSGIVADVLGGDPDDVTVIAGDTAAVAEGTGTFASRSAQLAGSALHRTAGAVRERVTLVAGAMLEVNARDLVVNGDAVRVAGDPTGGVTLAQVIERAAADGVSLAADEAWSAKAQTFPYGAYAAVVAVDLATGLVTLRRIVAVDDCGRVLHPAIVEGQTHGSLAQGIGQALYEQVHYGPDGQPQVSSLVDYNAPCAPDLPHFTTDRLVSPAPSNPLGVKGAGEAGCIGAPPAIVNATLDALRPHGVTHLDMPLHPERVWRALQSASA